MLFYGGSDSRIDVTLGRDAACYHAGTPNVCWNDERQPFGYRGIVRLLAAISQALEGGSAA